MRPQKRKRPSYAKITATPRIVFLPNAIDPDGTPRVGLIRPGDRHPSVFPNIAAALAASRNGEARA